MTRQETLKGIGECKPSTFTQANIKNQMSYFIIPTPHEVYKKKNYWELIFNFKKLGWEVANPKEAEADRIFSHDARSMGSIKSYLYNQMLPQMQNNVSQIDEFFSENQNLLLQKDTSSSQYNFKCNEYETTFHLDAIDLWILDEHIAFFVLKTRLTAEDESSVSDISSKFNRTMRDFKALYYDDKKQLFSNSAEQGVSVLDWLYSLVEIEEKSLLSHTEEKVQTLQNRDEYYPIFHTSYNAKMITAMHIDEMQINGEDIEPTFKSDLIHSQINGTSAIEETPYYLASTSELYPSKGWESNEEFLNDQVNNGEINIWKYWSGVVLHDSMAFFSIGDGGSAVVNSARNSYYFIYILNLYVNYKLRYFEHKLIDSEFTSIENIYPMFTDLQRLKNQFMGMEISSLFQPNIVHQAIGGAMKTDDIFDEIKDNVEGTLNLTTQNTDIMITAIISIFSVMGLWLNQEMMLDFFDRDPILAVFLSVVTLIGISIVIIKRSVVITKLKRWRKKIANKLR